MQLIAYGNAQHTLLHIIITEKFFADQILARIKLFKLVKKKLGLKLMKTHENMKISGNFLIISKNSGALKDNVHLTNEPEMQQAAAQTLLDSHCLLKQITGCDFSYPN